MNKIRAIFYDLDNTLYPQITDIVQRIDYCIHKFSLKNAGRVKALWTDEWKVNGPAKSDIIDRLINEFALEVDRGDFLAAYRNFRTQLVLEEEVYRFLVHVKIKSIKQFLITNGNAGTQQSKVSALKLEGLFDEIIVASDERRKPSTYWFVNLLEKHGLSPRECLSVGDWYAIDGVASVRAGISFLYKTGGPVKEQVPPNVPCLDKIAEIEEYLHE